MSKKKKERNEESAPESTAEVRARPADEADRADTAAAENEMGQYVTFYIGEECFAFPMESVLEIIRVPKTVEVPLTPSALLGLSNLRGSVLPVLDLRRLLALPDMEYTDATRVVVTDCGTPVGLVVDRVARVLNVERSQVEDGTQVNATVSADLLLGVVKNTDDQTLTQLLAPDRVVSSEFATVVKSQTAGGGGDFGQNQVNSKKTDAVVDDDETTQLVSFVVENQEYAFEISEVEEIVRVPEEISQVPKSQSYVLGLINLRGRLLPLVGLRRLFSMHEETIGEHNRVVVVSLHRENRIDSIGIVVDQVREVLRVPKAVQDVMPNLLRQPGREDEISVVCRLDGGKRLLSVLSAVALFKDATVQNAIDEATSSQEATMRENDLDQAEISDDDETQLVVFQLAGQEYGVTIEAVQEITRVPKEISKVPKTATFIEGMINLRGMVLPVLDMRRRFSLEQLERNDRQRILVLNLEGVCTGFITDSVTEVLRLPRSVIESSPTMSEHQARVMGRVANLKENKRMIQVLNVDALLDDKERTALKAA